MTHGPARSVLRSLAIPAVFAFFFGLGPPEPLSAQQSSADASGVEEVTEADYQRAERFLSRNLEEKFYGAEVTPRWVDGDRFWYRNRFAEGHEFVFVDPDQGSRERAFDHRRLARALDAARDTAHEAFDLPFTSFQYVDDRGAIRFAVDEEWWRCDVEEYRCSEAEDVVERPEHSVVSPDGRLAAFIRDHDLWVRDLESGEDIRLTTDGEARYGYATDSQGWRRTPLPVLAWSPESRRIKTYRLDERDVEDMHLLETAEPRVEHHSWPYALPGDEEVPMLERVVVDVEERDVVRLDAEPDHQRTSSCCGLLREGRLADVDWSADGETLAFVSVSRDYRHVRLRVADAGTGEVREVLEERSPTFIDTNPSGRGVPNWRLVAESGEVIWFSREDGWGHIYLHDLKTGERLNRITGGDWNVLDILHVDREERRVYFTGAGREEGRDPYFRHLYRVGLDGEGLELLTPEDADHRVELSPSLRHFVNARSTMVEPPVTVVRRLGGQAGPDSAGRTEGAPAAETVMTVEEADVSDLEEMGWRAEAAVPFSAKARDGETDIYGIMHLPSRFDPTRSYPIVNQIYPGPQIGSVGSRSFSLTRRGEVRALAELGFVVVQIDALGTPMRSREFHEAYYGDIADNGLPDQIAAMRELAERFPWIDIDRVGIYGHSGGGFATVAAMLQHPDFFHVGVAGAGNHDNRGYTYYWGEKWHGPLEEYEDESDSYENQALHLMAENLEGKLLLTYGTMDSNVHPNMTLLLVDELIRHNKDFDLIVLPNRGHGYGGEPYVIRRTWDYFVRHLLGAEPPREYEIEE